MLNDFEQFLDRSVDRFGASQTSASMKYSLLGGGKRIRPQLLFSLLEDFDCNAKQGYDAAAALEMIHTYSLVHDDLPAMDNDDYRRHRLTNHKVFGEAQAILGGDALLTSAFTLIAQSGYRDDQKVKLIEILARNAGALGMILGQEKDMDDAIETLEDLDACYALKTGCLLAAALEMACVIANHDASQSIAKDLGIHLGIAYQYQDDLLEATTQFETLGKSSSSDLDREKATVVTLLGIDAAQTRIKHVFATIDTLLDQLTATNQHLQALIATIISRQF